jgi:hypothetical protein
VYILAINHKRPKQQIMNRLLQLLLLFSVAVSCNKKADVDEQTYFLSTVNKYPFESGTKADTLSAEHKRVIEKYKLKVYIPKEFRSVVDVSDKEAFIFVNEQDSSMLLAKCFELNDSILIQVSRSEKYNHPKYGSDYNDLSEFSHFKSCEKLVAKENIGPFYFGGTMYELLGGKEVMHQEFIPKDNRFQYGEFTILYGNNVYVFICSLHNGFADYLHEKPRRFSIAFNELEFER